MKQIYTFFAVILMLILSANVSVANHKHGKHKHKHAHHQNLSPKKICEHSVGGALEGLVGSSCAVVETTFGAECLTTTAELAPENVALCAAGGGIIASLCVETLQSHVVDRITDALCVPHHGKHHKKHPHHKKHHHK